MTRRRIVFWQQVASIHQAAMLRALAARDELEIVLVVDRDVPAWRRESGWFDLDLGRVEVVHNEDASSTHAISTSGDVDFHIFSGLRAAPRRAFLRARGGRAKLGLYVEPGDPRGVRGAARRFVAAVEARRFRDDVAIVLAIGTAGEAWYRNCGYPAARVHRFGYFVDSPLVLEDRPARTSPKLVFVGRLISRKAVDVALLALAQLRDRPWSFDIVGDGPERPALEQLACALGIADRVRFLGMLSNVDARTRVAAGDVFLLPSREDGWGAVVNEALMSGVPVICSSACGAADLIRQDRGSVVSADSVSSLREALDGWTRAPLAPQLRARIQAWSTRITGESGAAYLLEVLTFVDRGGARPIAPWLRA